MINLTNESFILLLKDTVVYINQIIENYDIVFPAESNEFYNKYVVYIMLNWYTM